MTSFAMEGCRRIVASEDGLFRRAPPVAHEDVARQEDQAEQDHGVGHPIPIWYHWKAKKKARMCRFMVASAGPPTVVA